MLIWHVRRPAAHVLPFKGEAGNSTAVARVSKRKGTERKLAWHATNVAPVAVSRGGAGTFGQTFVRNDCGEIGRCGQNIKQVV